MVILNLDGEVWNLDVESMYYNWFFKHTTQIHISNKSKAAAAEL